MTQDQDRATGVLDGAPPSLDAAKQAIGPPRRRRGLRLRAVNTRRLGTRTGAVLIALAVIVAIWQLICSFGQINSLLLPTPWGVAKTLWNERSLLLDNTKPTATESIVGFLIAVAVGIPFGYVISIPSIVRSFLTTTMLSAQIFPKTAIAPLVIVWFGFGMGPKFLFIFLMCFFPIALSAQAGFASVPNEVRELGRVIGLSRWEVLRKLQMPWSLPQIFTGLKIAVSHVVTGAIVYEFIGSNSGLGHIILSAGTNLATDLMFAAFIVVTVLGFVIYGAIALLEIVMIPWHISRRAQR